MKKVLLVITTSCLSFSAFGQSKLACWNLFAKKGAKPFLTASIVRDDELSDIVINQDQEEAKFDTKGMKNSSVGKEITTNRSPYKGAQEFFLGTQDIRLILPLNLGSENLAQTSFSAGNLPRNLQSRQNGVLDVVGKRYAIDQGGDGYTRMHCISK